MEIKCARKVNSRVCSKNRAVSNDQYLKMFKTNNKMNNLNWKITRKEIM